MSFIRKIAKLCLILFSLILSAELCIVLIYWTTVFPASKEWDAAELANDIHMHGIYLIMIMIEYLGSTIVIRYGSFVWQLCFGVVFGLWTLIYWLAGGEDFKDNKYIYPLMNWGEYPQTAIGLWLFAIIFLPLIHLGLVRMKTKMLNNWIQKYKLKRRDSLNNTSTTQDNDFKENMNSKLTDGSNNNNNNTQNTNNRDTEMATQTTNANSTSIPTGENNVNNKNNTNNNENLANNSPVTVPSGSDQVHPL